MKTKRISLFLSIASTTTFLPVAIVSCSKNNQEAFFASSDQNIYQSIWNTSFTTFIDESKLNEYIYSTKIEDLEKLINDQIKNSTKTTKIIKIYLFSILWQSIKNPYSRDGKRVSLLSEDLKKYSDFLSNLVKPDNINADKKTYKNFDAFIDSIYDFKINILPFDNNNNTITINKQKTVGEIISNNKNKDTLELLNFQFEFKIKNDRANELMLQKDDKTKHIFYRTKLDKDEKLIIRKYKDQSSEIANIISNQFNYQGSKMYYDIDQKVFKTIVLTDNVKYDGTIKTRPSGFKDDSDAKRNLFYFDFRRQSEKKYQQFLILNLSSSSYFDTSLTSDFRKYLEEQKILVDGSMKKLEFNLYKDVAYEPIKNENNDSNNGSSGNNSGTGNNQTTT